MPSDVKIQDFAACFNLMIRAKIVSSNKFHMNFFLPIFFGGRVNSMFTVVNVEFPHQAMNFSIEIVGYIFN